MEDFQVGAPECQILLMVRLLDCAGCLVSVFTDLFVILNTVPGYSMPIDLC